MLQACFSLQFLQMALSSCIRELKAGRPEEDTPLPWVHLAYQHFRIRLQNFSRILTIHSQVLNSLAGAMQSRDLEGHEMVWSPLEALTADSQGLAFLERVGGGLRGRALNGRLLDRPRA